MINKKSKNYFRLSLILLLILLFVSTYFFIKDPELQSVADYIETFILFGFLLPITFFWIIGSFSLGILNLFIGHRKEVKISKDISLPTFVFGLVITPIAYFISFSNLFNISNITINIVSVAFLLIGPVMVLFGGVGLFWKRK